MITVSKKWIRLIGIVGCTVWMASCKQASDAGVKSSSYAVMQIEAVDKEFSSSYSASIRGRQDIDIYPQVSGTIEKLCVTEGQKVRRGQSLFIIDQVPYKAALKTAIANVEAARAALGTAELTYKSNKELYAQKVVSEFSLKTAENSYLTAKAQLSQAEAQEISARNNLSYTEVKSPSDGVVGALPYRAGALVSANMPYPLTTVSDNSDMYVYFSMTENQLLALTRQYGDAWGLPFSCRLPQLDVSSVSFQFGFVGQQPGIGYQLIRYGDMEKDQEAYEKGNHIIDFWVNTSMTEIGAPNVCYNPALQGFEPMPFWTRMISDGLENILDAYVYMRKKGEERPAWLAFCRKAADWFVRIQNEDGSWYRAYNTEDGSMRMESKANTISAVRFLIQLYLVTGEDSYRETALRAGEWSYQNIYRNMEYRGSTCDNTDITDNESGIYAMFGFLSLYDLTGQQKWLDALIGAADYTETWTYMWSYPMKVLWPNHPFSKNSFSGQSPVTIGGGGGDMYMAACAYVYYRLYIITGDEHYHDFAEFIHNNTRQANDVDGSFGYALPGLSHEGGHFATQTFTSHYHWLPWVTYVEIDPTSRLYDTFGAYDIAGADKLSMEERIRRNRIYDTYGKC